MQVGAQDRPRVRAESVAIEMMYLGYTPKEKERKKRRMDLSQQDVAAMYHTVSERRSRQICNY